MTASTITCTVPTGDITSRHPGATNAIVRTAGTVTRSATTHSIRRSA